MPEYFSEFVAQNYYETPHLIYSDVNNLKIVVRKDLDITPDA